MTPTMCAAWPAHPLPLARSHLLTLFFPAEGLAQNSEVEGGCEFSACWTLTAAEASPNYRFWCHVSAKRPPSSSNPLHFEPGPRPIDAYFCPVSQGLQSTRFRRALGAVDAGVHLPAWGKQEPRAGPLWADLGFRFCLARWLYVHKKMAAVWPPCIRRARVLCIQVCVIVIY